MQLEIGKIYENRLGEQVKVRGEVFSDPRYRFIDSQERTYQPNGRYLDNDCASDLDLTKEVKMTKKLEIGKTYKNKKGDSIEIIHYVRTSMSRNGYYRFIGVNRKKGSIGLYSEGGDCVSKVSDDHLKIGKTITIDGRDIEISEESFNELKRSLLND